MVGQGWMVVWRMSESMCWEGRYDTLMIRRLGDGYP